MKRRTGSHLFFRVYINYACLMILFSVVLGIIYMRLYQSTMMEDYRKNLEGQAATISKRLNEYILNEEYTQCRNYLENLLELTTDEIWTISNSDAKEPMNEQMENVDLKDVSLSEELQKIIRTAFSGQKRYGTYYSEIHGCTMITLGIPIIGKNGETCGALLLSAQMEVQDKAADNGFSMMVNSMLGAAVVSFIIAIMFARQLTKPIMKMRETALDLVDSKYDTKTGIDRKDEIGDLARTLDFLTDKLQENEKIRKNLDQMRLDFFANVSHELRTPITVVRAYTESLVDGVVTGEEKTKQYYERMLSECKSMERLVGDLLLLSKMQNPDFVIETEPVNLLQIFEELVRSIHSVRKRKFKLN